MQQSFDSDMINSALASVAQCFDVSDTQKEILEAASRDQVLAAIAQTATIGTVPTVVTLCLISATNAYFDHSGGLFDYDNWRATLDTCAAGVPAQIQPCDPAMEVRPGVTLLLTSYAVAIVVAEIEARLTPAPSPFDGLSPSATLRPN